MFRSLDIGLDIDGVLYPFVEVLAGYATRTLGRECTDRAESFEWYEHQWGLTKAEFVQLCAAAVRDGVLFTEGAPLPGALAATRAFAEAGHRIHYVSARETIGVGASDAWRRTAAWLSRWQFPVDSLTISQDKAGRRTDIFLDDSPYVLDALLADGHPCPVLWCHSPVQTHAARQVLTWEQFHAVVHETATGDRPATLAPAH